MADVSVIQLPNGDSYNIKDAVARTTPENVGITSVYKMKKLF
jgi:hypothetical protein